MAELFKDFLLEVRPNLKDKQLTYLCERLYNACYKYSMLEETKNQENVKYIKINFLIKKLRHNPDYIDALLQKPPVGGDHNPIRVKPLLYENLQECNTELADERNRMHTAVNLETGRGCTNYRCPKCKARNHTEVQVMLRASDEATAIKCTCIECNTIFWH